MRGSGTLRLLVAGAVCLSVQIAVLDRLGTVRPVLLPGLAVVAGLAGGPAKGAACGLVVGLCQLVLGAGPWSVALWPAVGAWAGTGADRSDRAGPGLGRTWGRTAVARGAAEGLLTVLHGALGWPWGLAARTGAWSWALSAAAAPLVWLSWRATGPRRERRRRR